MFELCALLLQQIKLRDRGIQQGLLLRQVQPGGDAAFMAMVHQDKSFLLNLDRLLHHLIFGIEFAQAEVVSSEFRGQDQLNILQIGRRALQAGVGGLQSLTGSTEQIDFVVQAKGTWYRLCVSGASGVVLSGRLPEYRLRDAPGSALSVGNSPADATRASERA